MLGCWAVSSSLQSHGRTLKARLPQPVALLPFEGILVLKAAGGVKSGRLSCLARPPASRILCRQVGGGGGLRGKGAAGVVSSLLLVCMELNLSRDYLLLILSDSLGRAHHVA